MSDSTPEELPYEPKRSQEYTIKDSGERVVFNSGMNRDVSTGKMRPDLVKDGPMFLRWVRLMTRGAVKYAARNWMKATGQEEYDRFLESADRHYEIWYTWRRYGINIEDVDNPTTEPLKEDHAAAVFFNINGAEYTVKQMDTHSEDEQQCADEQRLWGDIPGGSLYEAVEKQLSHNADTTARHGSGPLLEQHSQHALSGTNLDAP